MATNIHEQAYRLATEQILVTMENQNIEAFYSVYVFWMRLLGNDCIKEIVQVSLGKARQKMDTESYKLLTSNLFVSTPPGGGAPTRNSSIAPTLR